MNGVMLTDCKRGVCKKGNSKKNCISHLVILIKQVKQNYPVWCFILSELPEIFVPMCLIIDE